MLFSSFDSLIFEASVELVSLHWMQFFTCSLQALVDAPDMVRSQMNFKRISLTDIKIDINRVPKKKALIEAMEKAGKG